MEDSAEVDQVKEKMKPTCRPEDKSIKSLRNSKNCQQRKWVDEYAELNKINLCDVQEDNFQL